MKLDSEFITKFEAIKSFMMGHETYQNYIDQIDQESFDAMKATLDPYLMALFNDVAGKAPLQLIALEDLIMDEELEGLFLPEILTFNVLRASVNDKSKFTRTPDRLERIIRFICISPGFDFIKNTIRLPLRLSLVMSSSIWGHKLAESIQARRSREYILQQLQEARRDEHASALQYKRLRDTYRHIAYQSAPVPVPGSTWKIQYIDFRKFIIDRINHSQDNAALKPSIYEMLNEEYFSGSEEIIELLILLAHFFELEDDDFEAVEELFARFRANHSSFNEVYFDILRSLLLKDELTFSTSNAAIISDLLESTKGGDDLTEFYHLMTACDESELLTEDFVAKVELFSSQHRELVPVTSCLKIILLQIIDHEISEILGSDYTTLPDRIYLYDRIAEAFLEASYRESVAEVIVGHLKVLMFYYDKSEPEFKEIKKMVGGTPVDYGFITMKEIRSLYRQHQAEQKTKENK